MSKHIHLYLPKRAVPALLRAKTGDDWAKWNEEHKKHAGFQRAHEAAHKADPKHENAGAHKQAAGNHGNAAHYFRQAAEHHKAGEHEESKEALKEAHSSARAAKEYEEVAPLPDHESARAVKAHPNYNKQDHEYLKNKGWSDKEIKERWDQEHKAGKGPQAHAKAPDVVGVLGGKKPTHKDPKRTTPLRHAIAHKEMVKKIAGRDGSPNITISLEHPEKGAAKPKAGASSQSKPAGKSAGAEQVDQPLVGTGAPMRPPLKAARNVEVLNKIDECVRGEDWPGLKKMDFAGAHPLCSKYRDELVEFEQKRSESKTAAKK